MEMAGYYRIHYGKDVRPLFIHQNVSEIGFPNCQLLDWKRRLSQFLVVRAVLQHKVDLARRRNRDALRERGMP